MKRAQRNIAAFTLPVRPQHRKELSITGKKRKYLEQKSRATSKELPDTRPILSSLSLKPSHSPSTIPTAPAKNTDKNPNSGN